MATEVVKTIKASGGDYASLDAFAAGEARNLVTADEIAVAEVYDFEDNVKCEFDSSWTTDATRYIHIRPAPGEGHGGVWGTTGYRLIGTGSGQLLEFDHSTIHAIVEGIQLRSTPGSDFLAHLHFKNPTAGFLKVIGCIFNGNNTGDQPTYMGIWGPGGGPDVEIRNCVFLNITGVTGGTNLAAIYDCDGRIYNCTFINNWNNLRNCNGTAKANVFQDVDNETMSNCGGIVSDYNTTSEVSESHMNGDHDVVNHTTTFKSSTEPALIHTDVVNRGGGVDLSADSDNPVTDDVAGRARNVAGSPDRGAYEFEDAQALAHQ
jgi:hypothetical protein